jgi:predicted membrane-bound mannosyltransferase
MKRAVFRGVATLLLGITCVLHFWKIGLLPSGLYGDECSIAYNAYCIAETGADEYGTRYPVFFRGFDNYHDPVMVYSLVPLIKVFGLQESVARLPSAVFHILASVIFALLVQEYCRDRWISLACGFVFSVIPWAFPVSRTVSAGYTPMLFGMVAGWLWLLKAFGERSHGYAVAAGVA